MRPYQESLIIGKTEVPRRVFLPPHSYNFASTAAGRRSTAAYVERRLAAGVPLAIIGEAEVSTLGAGSTGTPGRVAGEASRELYRNLRGVMERTGGLIFEQLHHPGGQVWFEEERSAYAPSSYPQARSYVLPIALTTAEIASIRAGFIAAAMPAWEEGLSGIEIKLDQGKLLHQFLSREYNRRTDHYGGVLNNRIRFILEILNDLRQNAPPGFILGARLSGPITPPEPLTAGVVSNDLTFDETREIIEALQADRLVDYISLSGETNSSVWGYRRNHGDEDTPTMTFSEIGSQLRSTMSVPLLLSGRILSLDDADEALRSGACDMVGMARALIADAELIEKEETLPRRPTRPCLSCNISCVGRTWYGQSVACVYDPRSGRELATAPPRKRRMSPPTFAVVGAGPAGLEFARAATSFGARVTIFEKGSDIGGALRSWALLPGRTRLWKALDFWASTIDLEPLADLRLNTDFDAECAEDFDKIIWACGATPALPPFAAPSSVPIYTTASAVEISNWEGFEVVLIEGDRYQDPLGVAVHVVRRGGRVCILSPYDQIGVGLDPVSRAARMDELEAAGTVFHTWSDIRFNSDGEPVRYDHGRNRILPLSADVVIWCINPLPPLLPLNAIKIGDCDWPRGLEAATRSAFDLARKMVTDSAHFMKVPSR